jgi:hypothetical protein
MHNSVKCLKFLDDSGLDEHIDFRQVMRTAIKYNNNIMFSIGYNEYVYDVFIWAVRYDRPKLLQILLDSSYSDTVYFPALFKVAEKYERFDCLKLLVKRYGHHNLAYVKFIKKGNIDILRRVINLCNYGPEITRYMMSIAIVYRPDDVNMLTFLASLAK